VQVLVVADKTTPLGWTVDGAMLLSVAEQEKLSFQIAKLLPWHSYLYATALCCLVLDVTFLSCEVMLVKCIC
jgi:hypothetical protein